MSSLIPLRRGLVGARLAYCMANPLYTTRVAEFVPSLSYLAHLAQFAGPSPNAGAAGQPSRDADEGLDEGL